MPGPKFIVYFFILLFSFSGCKIKTTTTVRIRDLQLTELDSAKIAATKELIDTTKFYPVNSKNALQPIYSRTAKFLWNAYVPDEGQAETQQGELIRILEKVDREIRGNGKINWDDEFTLLANTLRDSLISSKTFTREIEIEIKNDIAELTNEQTAYTDDDIYDRLTRRIVEWYWRHKEPVKHVYNPKLDR